MLQRNIFALFCEDIRPEADNIVSLMGILPDNVNFTVPKPDEPGGFADPNVRVFTKLCVYVRINFDPDDDLPEARMRLTIGDDTQIDVGRIERKLVQEARDSAKKNGNPLAGVIARLLLGGFKPPAAPSNAMLEVTLGDDTYLAGAVRFVHIGEATATLPTASGLPS